VRAAVETRHGVAVVDLEADEIVALDDTIAVARPQVEINLPLVVAADSSGPLVVAVVARRPPLVVSRDAGNTWNQAGHGLPPGRFWHPLATELDDVQALAWLAEGDLAPGQ
jgi:hypothetical protein